MHPKSALVTAKFLLLNSNDSIDSHVFYEVQETLLNGHKADVKETHLKKKHPFLLSGHACIKL